MNIESRAADLRTSIKLMTGDLCYCKTRAQVASLRETIRQREEELKRLAYSGEVEQPFRPT